MQISAAEIERARQIFLDMSNLTWSKCGNESGFLELTDKALVHESSGIGVLRCRNFPRNALSGSCRG